MNLTQNRDSKLLPKNFIHLNILPFQRGNGRRGDYSSLSVFGEFLVVAESREVHKKRPTHGIDIRLRQSSLTHSVSTSPTIYM